MRFGRRFSHTVTRASRVGGYRLLRGGDMRILFVCTGNYYRSRYAEVRLDDWATHRDLPLSPFSRGLQIDIAQTHNVGPMSRFAIARLRERGINPDPYLWMPRALERRDLDEADLTVILDRREHLPMMRQQFPDFVDRVRSWDVADGRPTAARHPLAEVDAHLESFFQELRNPA